jgi:hypothetical protein
MAAPLAVVGLIALSLTVATVLWGVWNARDLSPAFWATLVTSAVIGAASFASIHGCFVEIDDDRVRDVVGWFTVRRLDRRHIRTARVRRGIWRLYVVELDDDRVITLVGASPMQFPARLLPDAMGRDVSDLDLILGPD